MIAERSQSPKYPKREPFFAYRVIRLMAKTAAAQVMGPESDGGPR